MMDTLEFQIDKFLFKIALDRRYSPEGVWVKLDDKVALLGVSDYLQGRSGDVAFAEIKPVGTEVVEGEEIATIETIKVNISLGAPVAGKVIEVNPALETSAEVINQDPYGEGWLAVIELSEGKTSFEHLLDAQAYYTKTKREAEQEVGKK